MSKYLSAHERNVHFEPPNPKIRINPFVAVTYWYTFGPMSLFQERVRGGKQVDIDFAVCKVMSRDERTYEGCFELLGKLVFRYVKDSFSFLQDDFL